MAWERGIRMGSQGRSTRWCEQAIGFKDFLAERGMGWRIRREVEGSKMNIYYYVISAYAIHNAWMMDVSAGNTPRDH